MDILKIFQSDKEGIRKSYVKNLISIAMADGQVGEDEWELLAELGSLLGMTEAQIIKIRENPDAVEFIPPKTHEERLQQVRDFVAIMTIDGNIDEKELSLCKKIALKLDVLPQIVDEVVNTTMSKKTKRTTN